MTTIKIPARYVPYLQSAAVYSLGEEADRTREAETAVFEAMESEESKLKLAREELANVRPFLGLMIPLAQRILALPADEDAELADEPELLFWVFHNMASKVLGPRLASELDYLPFPPTVPTLAEAVGWASAESVRLQAVRVDAERVAA